MPPCLCNEQYGRKCTFCNLPKQASVQMQESNCCGGTLCHYVESNDQRSSGWTRCANTTAQAKCLSAVGHLRSWFGRPLMLPVKINGCESWTGAGLRWLQRLDKSVRGWVYRGYRSAGHTVVCAFGLPDSLQRGLPPLNIEKCLLLGFNLDVTVLEDFPWLQWIVGESALNSVGMRHTAATNIKCRFLSSGRLFRPLIMKFMTIQRDKKSVTENHSAAAVGFWCSCIFFHCY